MRSSKIFLITSLMVASSAYADNVTVKVSGKITPPACQASIEGGDSLDWGKISHSALSTTGFTFLPAKTVTLKIQCDENLTTKMAFYTKDGNAASAMVGTIVPGTTLSNGDDANRIYGIGMDPVTNEKIGNFTLVSKSSSYDGKENKTKFGYAGKDAGNDAFAAADFGWGQNHNEKWTVLGDNNQPATANVFTFTFDAVPQINLKSKITNSQEVAFSGSAQFTVTYF